MPLFYRSILEEHQAVRQRVGLFDISHMGEFFVRDAAALNRVLTNDLERLAVGRGQYSLMCHPDGGVLDDLIVYRVEADRYLLVVNAANTETDRQWLRQQGVEVEDVSADTAAMALQGPWAARLWERAAGLPAFGIEAESVSGLSCWVARTGYTGEDGFEILCPAAAAELLWEELLQRGAALGIEPCGLGARDTLRLEACLPLHGQDLTLQTTPLEAGLGRFVAWDKGDFVGREALADQRKKGVARVRVAFKMTGGNAPPPRPGYRLWGGDVAVGTVTSGGLSPTLGVGIGMGYVATDWARPGQTVEVEIRGRRYGARVENKPLYQRGQ
jgi:aminomethyltransferase